MNEDPPEIWRDENDKKFPGDEPISIKIEPLRHKCPICPGNGLVPRGFYDGYMGELQDTSGLQRNFETCRCCNGKGWY